ncbi:type II toxin-antitoxin system Phd/YefM family antitoxin [Thiococcus pfennigii]|uniref:type II toxin-antitoxin system Phd/YefM family antitoxin n=1 Tax=Thiococcus pfennigii TaxID=1057 RepID=UPI00190448C8|nr:type II toxin-antitoxin system prevent-host-death family antitoxin [Thiococcus pfennigii]MBK1700527.1 prevent-host-death protein [Thiococcus pfennigii]MBK1730829.1 prevent-host-death protein [Thiococcus pfennigii]
MQVAVRELKAHLSRILSRAQAGEPIAVTSHNRLIARIVGIPAGTADGLRASIANGALSWSGRKPRPAAPVELSAQGTPVSRMVWEDRG